MKLFLPLVHDLEGVHCLVVGGGVRAARKARWLIAAQAELTVVTKDISSEFERELNTAGASLRLRGFEPADLIPSTRLVVCATDDHELHAKIYEIANQQRILVNCVDDPAYCSVTFPAIVDRSPLVISVSTGGAVPAMARIVRGWIEEIIPQHLGGLLQRIANMRATIKSAYSDLQVRTHVYNRLLSRQSLHQMVSETDEQTLTRLSQARQNKTRKNKAPTAILVGAGPGDPELITLKGLRAIQVADVIFYDQLANPQLLTYARRDAQKIFVGKQGPKPGETPNRKNNRSTQQESINARLVEAVTAGKQIVRLKGGDPFIYGRGGEEVELLLGTGVDVQVIPGITAALGAASYAGIPLTHRDHAQSVRFVTGHRVENTVNLDWPELGKPDQTLVVYMGLVGLREIAQKLISYGAEEGRPVALVENATLPEQRVVLGDLSNIADIALEAQIQGPTVAIIGNVVSFRGNL